MDSLPAEILLEIIDCLGTAQLTVVNRLNKSFYCYATPKLYSALTFHINPYTLDLTYKCTLLLERLLRSERLCAFVRAIDFEFVHEVWQTRLRRVNTQLLFIGALLLKNPQIRSNLRSFRWRLDGEAAGLPVSILLDAPATLTSLALEASQAPLSARFPLLREFECRNVASLEQASWVKLQFVHARSLRRACLCVTKGHPSMPITKLIPERLQAPSLTRLKLENVDIDQWPGASLETVADVSFRYCQRVCNGLLLSPRAKRSLRRFELVSHEPHPYLGAFLSDLANYTSLSHIALLLPQNGSGIPLAWLKPHRLSLQRLTIECRQNPDSYLSIYRYSMQDVVDALNDFPQLQHLGIPVLLNGAGKQLCKYLKDSLKVQPVLREFHARSYIQPGLTSIPKARSNARSFARAMLGPRNKTFTFLYGNRLSETHVWKLADEANADKRKLPAIVDGNMYEGAMAWHEWIGDRYHYF